MARGRKSTKVKILTSNDKELFKQAYKTGIVCPDLAKEHLNISQSRLDKLANSGYFTKEVANIKGEFKTVYKPSSVVRDFVKERYDIGKMYHYASVEHDLQLTNQYYSIDRELRDTIRCETDYKQKGVTGTVDMTYQESDGSVVAIEIVTVNYKDHHIQSKVDFCKNNDMKLLLKNTLGKEVTYNGR